MLPVKALSKSVQWAGADIAINYTERAKNEDSNAFGIVRALRLMW